MQCSMPCVCLGMTVTNVYVWFREWQAVCSPKNCNASADPTNGKKGGCTSDLGNGKNCLYECDAGYTVSGLTKCNATAELTKATCGASTCDATKTPQNGALGACADKAALASGAKCKPTCETGYELTPGDGHACLRGTVTEVRNNQCSVRCRVCALA